MLVHQPSLHSTTFKGGRLVSKFTMRDMSHLRVGRLFILSVFKKVVRTNGSVVLWHCLCDCGNYIWAPTGNLRPQPSGRINTVSCGCWNREATSARNRNNCPQNGMSTTIEYHSWSAMISRCKHRPGYAGRGITVCERWLGKDGFLNFFADMGRKPGPKYQIDRINNNGNYPPGNCRWATPEQNARNTRSNHLLTHNGHTATIAEWASLTGIGQCTLRVRLINGWSVEDALTLPIRQRAASPSDDFA